MYLVVMGGISLIERSILSYNFQIDFGIAVQYQICISNRIIVDQIVLNLGIGCPILKFGHIHIFQRELNPNLFRVDLTLGEQGNRLHMR